MHGFLYGYDDKSNNIIKRGRRIFCSNRNKKNGCGKTISILKAVLIKGFTFTATTLCSFLDNLLSGFNIKYAFKIIGIPCSRSSPYRLLKRFKLSQTKIRTYLKPKIPIKQILEEIDPFLLTVKHLKTTFKQSKCPIKAFQYTFQRSIF